MSVKYLTGLVVAIGVLAGTATAADDATRGPGSSASPDNLGKLYQELRQLESSAAERRSSLVTLRRDLENMKASLDQMSEGIDPVAPPADYINRVRRRSPTPLSHPETRPAGPAPALAATESGSMIREMRRQMAPTAAPKRPTAPKAPATRTTTAPVAPAAAKPRAQAPARIARAPSPPPPQRPAAQPTAPAMAKPSGATTRIQLASYRSRNNAERGWADMKKSYPDLLGDLEPEFVQVDIPDKGRFERLIVRAPTARNLCPQLKARGAYCIKAR